jgi:hypothetical protein
MVQKSPIDIIISHSQLPWQVITTYATQEQRPITCAYMGPHTGKKKKTWSNTKEIKYFQTHNSLSPEQEAHHSNHNSWLPR